VRLVLSPMKSRRDIDSLRSGYCLAELLVVLSLVGISLSLGMAAFTHVLEHQQARGAAQTVQAAVAWAQVGAAWRDADSEVALTAGRLTVGSGPHNDPSDLGLVAPSASVSANVSRWQTARGVILRFLTPFGAPDSGGSLRIESGGASYKITVRPESGLTSRSWTGR
jgi:Tfp pilus assembly protein FimT